MSMNLEKLYQHTLKWAEDRKITVNGNSTTQTLKLMSEMGELADAIIKHDHEEIKDGIGDCLVVLSIIAKLEGLSLEECWEAAWNDIKDRKGILLKNGTFVKTTDSNYERLVKENQN